MNAGLSTERIYECDGLVAGEGLFVASGVTGGNLLRGPWQQNGQIRTDSIVIAAGSVRNVVEASAWSEATTGDKSTSGIGEP